LPVRNSVTLWVAHRLADPVSCMSQLGEVLVPYDTNHINAKLSVRKV
jgi:hypothetical protein